jgi:PAS domain S-box-containing protein
MSVFESSIIGPNRRPSAPLPPASVLLIDDEASVCHTLSSLLEAEGYAVVTAQSGRDALKLLESRRIDVALTDLLMPEMDGIQTMEALKGVDPDLEVIVLTGHAAIRAATDALKRGACDYLQKPITVMELSAALRRAVELRRLKTGGCPEAVTGAPGAAGHPDLALSQLIKRRRTEEELRLTQFSVDHATDAVFWVDPKGRILYANEAACLSLGRTREEVLALSISDIDPLVARIGWEKAWQLTKESRSRTFETEHRRKDGSAFPVEVSVGYLEFGGREYGFSFVRDITERKRAELALQASERRYRRFVERSAAGVIRNTLDGVIIDCNQATLRFLGYDSLEQLKSHRIQDLYCDPKVRDIILSRLRNEKVLTAYEFRFRRKDGTAAWLIANLTLAEEGGQQIIEATVVDISGRKQAEEALRHREAELRDALRAAQMGVWNWALDTNTVTWDEALFGIAGRDPKLPAPSFTEQAEIFAPESLQRIKAAVENTLATGTAYELDLELVLPDGSKKWVIARGEPRRDATGRIACLRGTVQDITERKRSEEVKALLASIVESSDNAIIGKTLDGTILSWNKGAEILYGYSADEVVGRPISILVPADRSTEIPDILARIRRGEKVSHYETVRMRKGGIPVNVAVTVSPILSGSGEVTGAATIAHDISERKRAEELLRKLSRAVEQSPAAVVITDVHGAIEYVNPKFTEITGYSAAEAKGQTPRILKSGIQSPAVYEELWKTILAGEEWRGEFANKKKSGEIYWEAASIVPIRDAAGAITHFLGVKEDITARKKADEELRRAKEAAEAANRAKSQFLANMSHEIRTPMNGVIGMAGLLLDTELSLEQRRYAEIVRSSGEALLTVINEILDFSKIEARKLNLECADFDLRSVLEYAASLVGIKTIEKKLELVFEVVPGTPCLLRGDAGRLRQVLVNLLGNAVKFTPQGEVAVTVRVDSEDEHKATLHFTVRDTGIGFRQEQASVLFEPFVQADGSRTRRYGGTGLGLTISKQLVEMMGGQIGVESQEGKGATFWFTATFEKQPAANAHSTGIQPKLEDVRVLVVDDNAPNRRLLSTVLRSWGCRPEESGTADGALAVLGQAARTSDPFRIAILDMDLPGKDGLELGRQIASDPQLEPTALYLMTGFGRSVDGARLEAMRFAGQITKPIWERKLLETLLATGKQGRTSEDAVGSISGSALPRAGAEPKSRILVAEDNPSNREVAGMVLEKLGFSPDLVANGLEALRALQERDYDLLLLDCEMPEMDGYETARRIRDPRTGTRNPLIPIVALTADAIAGDREKCLEEGMDDYVAKPVEPSHLAEVLGKWLATPGAHAGRQPSRAARSTRDVFRPDALLARLSGDEELARKVVAGFLSRLPQQVTALRLSVEKHDAQSTSLQAHALKGAAATVAADSLRAACCELQNRAKAGDFARALALVPKLEEEVNLLAAAVRQSGWV